MLRRTALAAALFAAAGVPGCSNPPPPVVPVVGRVTLNGKPLPKAEVRFYPINEFGGEFIAVGVTDEDGNYALTCNGQPGACACPNRVTVAEGPLPDALRGYSGEAQVKQANYLKTMKNRPIPPQFGNLAASTLKVDVAAGQTKYDFDLTR